MSKIIDGRNGGKLKAFEPGESGNNKGRPKGSKNIATILLEYLEKIDKSEGGEGIALNIPAAKLIKLMSAKNEAVQLRAIQEILDRLEGKAEENINIIPAMPKIVIMRDDDD